MTVMMGRGGNQGWRDYKDADGHKLPGTGMVEINTGVYLGRS